MATAEQYRAAAIAHNLTAPSPATLRRLVRRQIDPTAWAHDVDAQLMQSFRRESALEHFAETHGYDDAADLLFDQGLLA